jgi:hypothetical protein
VSALGRTLPTAGEERRREAAQTHSPKAASPPWHAFVLARRDPLAKVSSVTSVAIALADCDSLGARAIDVNLASHA